MSASGRPAWVWLALAISFCALAWGAWAIASLTRFGFVSPIEAATILLVPLVSFLAVFCRRWWGLLLALVFGVWLLGFSKFAGVQTAIATLIFYAPLALVAFMQHQRFKW